MEEKKKLIPLRMLVTPHERSGIVLFLLSQGTEANKTKKKLHQNQPNRELRAMQRIFVFLS